jgi:hypothetical protein
MAIRPLHKGCPKCLVVQQMAISKHEGLLSEAWDEHDCTIQIRVVDLVPD